jgi:hypothetical protein
MEEIADSMASKLEEVYGLFTEEYGRSKVCADIKNNIEAGLGNFKRVLHG